MTKSKPEDSGMYKNIILGIYNVIPLTHGMRRNIKESLQTEEK